MQSKDDERQWSLKSYPYFYLLHSTIKVNDITQAYTTIKHTVVFLKLTEGTER
jgi:hypothetical protein